MLSTLSSEFNHWFAFFAPIYPSLRLSILVILSRFFSYSNSWLIFACIQKIGSLSFLTLCTFASRKRCKCSFECSLLLVVFEYESASFSVRRSIQSILKLFLSLHFREEMFLHFIFRETECTEANSFDLIKCL